MNKSRTAMLDDAVTSTNKNPVTASRIRSAKSAWTNYVLGLIALVLLLFALSSQPYYQGLLSIGIMFAGLAVAWNIIGGFGGQFSLANSVFFGVGAYSVALMQVNLGWHPIWGMLLGIALSVAIAAALSWPLFRLRGPYFAIGTLALALVALALATYFDWTGGALGVRIPNSERLITDYQVWAFVFLAFLALCIAVALFIARGKLGYYLVAVRDNHDAASAVGASPLKVKATGFVISAILTSIGGGLYVMYLGFLDPPSFLGVVQVAAYIPLLALIGGIGTVVGPVIGGLILPPFRALLRGELASLPPGITEAVLGLVLVLAALYFREGIWGRIVQLYRKLVSRRG